VRITKSVSLGQITWDKFPDGFPNIFVHDVEKLKVSSTFEAQLSMILNPEWSSGMPNHISSLLRPGILHIRANECPLLAAAIRPAQVRIARNPKSHSAPNQTFFFQTRPPTDSVAASRSSCPSSRSAPWSVWTARAKSPPPARSRASSPPCPHAGTSRTCGKQCGPRGARAACEAPAPPSAAAEAAPTARRTAHGGVGGRRRRP
jgi:hypothetical protein